MAERLHRASVASLDVTVSPPAHTRQRSRVQVDIGRSAEIGERRMRDANARQQAAVRVLEANRQGAASAGPVDLTDVDAVNFRARAAQRMRTRTAAGPSNAKVPSPVDLTAISPSQPSSQQAVASSRFATALSPRSRAARAAEQRRVGAAHGTLESAAATAMSPSAPLAPVLIDGAHQSGCPEPVTWLDDLAVVRERTGASATATSVRPVARRRSNSFEVHEDAELQAALLQSARSRDDLPSIEPPTNRGGASGRRGRLQAQQRQSRDSRGGRATGAAGAGPSSSRDAMLEADEMLALALADEDAACAAELAAPGSAASNMASEAANEAAANDAYLARLLQDAEDTGAGDAPAIPGMHGGGPARGDGRGRGRGRGRGGGAGRGRRLSDVAYIAEHLSDGLAEMFGQGWPGAMFGHGMPGVLPQGDFMAHGLGAGPGAGPDGWPPEPAETYEELLQLEDVKVTAPAAALRQLQHCKFGDPSSQRIKEDTCLVCQEDWEQGERLATLPCGHSFHDACVKRWLKEYSNKCPVCKETIR